MNGLPSRLLEKLEAGNPFLVEHDDFAVKEERPGLQIENGCGNSREVAGAVLCISGQQGNVTSFLISKDPVAVVFFFLYPAVAVERLANHCSQVGLRAKRDAGFQAAHRRLAHGGFTFDGMYPSPR